MSKSNLKMVGNFGCYLDDDNVKDVLPYSHQVHGLSSRWFQTS